jgi:hypothetical protein
MILSTSYNYHIKESKMLKVMLFLVVLSVYAVVSAQYLLSAYGTFASAIA